MAVSQKQTAAIQFVNNFANHGKAGKWPAIKKSDVVSGLLDRIVSPGNILQAENPSCGPTTFIYTLAMDEPKIYAKMVIDLYTLGEARVRALTIKAGYFLRNTKPMGKAHPVDWIAFASLRNSENYMWPMWLPWINNVAGMTLPSAVADWMKKVGYMDVNNSSSVLSPIMSVRAAWAHNANKFFRRNYQVLMFIDGDLLDSEDQDDELSLFPTHWVAMTGEIKDGGMFAYDSPITFKVWSWGHEWGIPVNTANPIKKRHFLVKFYGFVAGRF